MKQKNFDQHHGFKLEEVVIEDEFFTKERISEWQLFLSECCRDVCSTLFDMLDCISGISYFINKALIDETVNDAIIGMKKIINSTPNPVVKPNAFKIAAYLTYWFLRHKPISLLFNVTKTTDDGKTVYLDFHDLVMPKENVDKNYLIWQLNHINELVAVSFSTSFLFDFNSVVCDEKRCQYIIKNNAEANDSKNKECFFNFNSFEEQREFMVEKLTYYFAYRTIAPKVIEHILEGYSFHPAWKLTGAHWKTDE